MTLFTRPLHLAAKAATTSIPIVFYNSALAVELGIVARLSRPGGNLAGTTVIANQLATKQLAILREIVPNLSRLAVLRAEEPAGAFAQAEIISASKMLGIDTFVVNASGGDDFGPLFSDAALKGAEGVQVAGGTVIFNASTVSAQIVRAAAQAKLPTIYPNRIHVDGGGLISYSSNVAVTARRAATYVDRIIKGAKPQDLPVEQPTAFELVINLKTAKALGITIPATLLVQATQIIE